MRRALLVLEFDVAGRRPWRLEELSGRDSGVQAAGPLSRICNSGPGLYFVQAAADAGQRTGKTPVDAPRGHKGTSLSAGVPEPRLRFMSPM